MVCPGFIRSTISENALEGSKINKGTDPAVCAYDILCGVANRKHEIYVGHLASALIYLRRFFPWLLSHILLHIRSI
jgi:hypothetical protein